MPRRDIQPAVYIVADEQNDRLYTGHTADLPKRILEHRERRGSRYAAKHGIHRLVWYEFAHTLEQAQHREHLIKRWHREWKNQLIEEHNPNWNDLFEELA